MTRPDRQPGLKSPFDLVADLLVFAPLGLALRVADDLPELIADGRRRLEAPVNAAKLVGKLAVDQSRKDLGERLRKATEPYFGPSTPAPPNPSQGASAAAGDAASPEDAPGAGGSANLAIAGYETLSASQIIAHLGGLAAAERTAIASYERAHRARKTILARIDELDAR